MCESHCHYLLSKGKGPRKVAPAAGAAKTPRFFYRVQNSRTKSSDRMGRQSAGGGRSIQRSPSRSSLSASFEALAVYFPCMNSLEEEEGEEVKKARGGEPPTWRESGMRRRGRR
ncbi:UNVERIFIED_CONTAM: hypothetical protein K2H54_030611 [Gekko kuhli]